MNKKITAALLLSLLSMMVWAKDIYVSTSFHEPATEGLRFIYSRDGIRWDSIQGVFLRPQVGKQKVMRDPSIVRSPDGTFHLVWTSSWRGDRGFGYASSKDLIHWSQQRFIEVMDDTTTVNVWAPELFYDDVKKQFLVVWASCVPGRFPDHQEEHLNNHRLYYTTTKDFKTFAKTRLFYDPGFSDIDATLVKRGTRDYVMVVKDNSTDHGAQPQSPSPSRSPKGLRRRRSATGGISTTTATAMASMAPTARKTSRPSRTRRGP